MSSIGASHDRRAHTATKARRDARELKRFTIQGYGRTVTFETVTDAERAAERYYAATGVVVGIQGVDQ